MNHEMMHKKLLLCVEYFGGYGPLKLKKKDFVIWVCSLSNSKIVSDIFYEKELQMIYRVQELLFCVDFLWGLGPFEI